ncbi:hypothetical protein SLE2022_142920 [Rubroshorea leprosula]
MAPKSSLFLAILAVWILHRAHGHDGHHHAVAPAPAVDCSSLVLNMADCLSYVSSGGTASKPEGTCCSGLKMVLNTDAECLCEAFKQSASLGVTLNVTKALSLPAACKINAPAASKCGLSLAPVGAPEGTPSIGSAPTASIGNEQVPAQAPGSSGSPIRSVSVGYLVLGSVIALLFSF